MRRSKYEQCHLSDIIAIHHLSEWFSTVITILYFYLRMAGKAEAVGTAGKLLANHHVTINNFICALKKPPDTVPLGFHA